MAYCTIEDFKTRFGEDELLVLAGDDNGQLDQAKVEMAINAATEQADSYIGARSELPLDPVPAVLTDYVADLVRYRLADDPDKMSEEIKQRRIEAVQWLKDIATGKAVLPGVSREKIEGGIHVQARERVFTSHALTKLMG